jgi:hypothetical protein
LWFKKIGKAPPKDKLITFGMSIKVNAFEISNLRKLEDG